MASRTTTNLRREARSRGIPRYSVLSRPALVKALHEATKKETAEDILYQLPAELGALVLEGLADPEFQYATGEWKGPQKTKEKATKLALEPCCVASDRGRRCYSAAKQNQLPGGGGCELMCARHLASIILTYIQQKPKTNPYGGERFELKGETKIGGDALVTSRFYQEWEYYNFQVQLHFSIVPTAQTDKLGFTGRGMNRIFVWDPEQEENKKEIRERDAILQEISRQLPPEARRFFEIWKEAGYGTASCDSNRVRLNYIEELRPFKRDRVWVAPLISARMALAYPDAFNYLSAIETETNLPAVDCVE